MIKRRLTVGLAATLLLVGLQGLIETGIAQAQETNESCSNVGITASSQNIGDKQVVISVHGLGSTSETWGIRDERAYEGSMHQAIDSIDSDTYYHAFDYSERNQFWVTDPDIGPKLADTIVCLAQLSRDGGGIGEVVLVTHSMGGLAAKLATSFTPGDVGLVVNIGTPHKGSFYANVGSWGMDRVCSGVLRVGQYLARLFNDAACDENAAIEGLSIDSDKLGELPHFPDDVSVKAIAGNVTHQLKFGRLVLSSELNSDLVVPTYSAQDVYTDNGDGDGVEEVGCTGFVTTPVIITDASCAHTKMLRDPDIQQLVKDSIEAFIAANQPEPNQDVNLDIFGKLSVPMDGINYEELDGELPGLDYKISDTTDCLGGDACPYVSFIDTEGASGADVYQYMSMHGCMMDVGTNDAPPESVRQIGGKDVIFTESYNNYYNYTSYCWLGIEHGLSVIARSEGAVPFDAERWQSAFDRATWL